MSDLIGLMSSIRGFDTKLSTDEEKSYRQWIIDNKLTAKGIDPDTFTGRDYDMRGFYKALMAGDTRAVNNIDPIDKQIHFPDTWKKPTHESFSDESIYAKGDLKKYAGSWIGDMYIPPLRKYGSGI